MSDPRPRLAVVEGGAAEPSREAPPRTPTRRSRAVIVAWVLAVLLGIALGGVAQQGRRADALAQRLAGLEVALEAAEGAVQAHRNHLEAVRGSVADLQSLLAEEPAAPPPPAGGPVESR